MNHLPKPLYPLLVTVVIAFIASACSLGGPDPTPVPQTRIIDIRLTPDTVAVGDTVLIHAVIEDSLDSKFEFFWGLNEERKVPVNGTINGPRIKWWANGFDFLSPGEIQSVRAGIRVSNGSDDSVEVIDSFIIPVIKLK